jgi:hypothetical protein
MTLTMKLDSGYNWGITVRSPWPLGFCKDSRAYIEFFNSNITCELGSCLPYSSLIIWSNDGGTVFWQDCDYKLRYARVNSRNVNDRQDITPKAWKSATSIILSGLHWSNGLFLLTRNNSNSNLSLWRVVEAGNQAKSIEIDHSINFGSSVQICHGNPVLIEPNLKKSGVVTVTQLADLKVSEIFLSSNPLGFFTFVSGGTMCLYSACLNSSQSQIFLANLETNKCITSIAGRSATCSIGGGKIAVMRANCQEVLVMVPETNIVERVVAMTPVIGREQLPFSVFALPSWSPDGRWLVVSLSHWVDAWKDPLASLFPAISFQTQKYEHNGQHVFVIDTSDKTVIPLQDSVTSWSWSPRSEER